MPTGYEVQMYVDIHRIREALERIADALESIDNRQREAAGDNRKE